MIQIHEKHLGPFAGREEAEQLITALAALGWLVEYTNGPAVWHFESVDEMWRFEKHFELAREAIAGEAYRWEVTFPCPCRIDRPCSPEHGLISEQVEEARYIDHDRHPDSVRRAK